MGSDLRLCERVDSPPTLSYLFVHARVLFPYQSIHMGYFGAASQFEAPGTHEQANLRPISNEAGGPSFHAR